MYMLSYADKLFSAICALTRLSLCIFSHYSSSSEAAAAGFFFVFASYGVAWCNTGGPVSKL